MEEKQNTEEKQTEMKDQNMGEAIGQKRGDGVLSPAAQAWGKAVEAAQRENMEAARRETEKAAQPSAKLPLVSICCLSFNHRAYIQDAIEGFLRQETDFPFEILIYDDASTDGTQDIIRAYAERHPDLIRPLLQKENQYSRGVSNTSVFNFPRVRGTYVAMCEGDDYWTDPHKLQMQIDYLQAHPDCALCFHSARILSVEGSLTAEQMRPYRGNRRIAPEEIVGKRSGYPTASMVFPAEIIKNLPEYYLDCPVGDIPMQLMMALRGYAYYIDRPMSVYRVGVQSSWTNLMKTGDYEAKQIRYREEMRRMYQAFDRESGGRFHQEAEEAARRIYFLTEVNLKHYDTVLQKKYRRFYRELDGRTRFFIQLEYLFPGLYRRLQAMAERWRAFQRSRRDPI